MEIFFLILIVVAIGSIFWNVSRSQEVLQHWADQNGYRLLEAKNAPFFRGPFFWTSTKGQTVYRVRVEDSAGRTRSGWVRCGSWAWGVLSDEAQVHWDD